MADSARYIFASHLAVLRSCPDVISRLIKTGGSILLAAKVLVISRLLHTKLTKLSNPPPYLEVIRHKIWSLRRRLLARVDRRFKRPDVSTDAIIEAMCAFSLATSSSAKVVLQHYYQIRQESLSDSMEKSEERHENLLLGLEIYVRTLRDTQAITPSQLAIALEKLKSVPLIKSRDVHQLTDLDLDVHERWIDDDIKTFTPYIKHEDITRAEIELMLGPWARQAFETFLNGLQHETKDVTDPFALMHLRRRILETWLSKHLHSLGVDAAEALDRLRAVFNLQAISIVQDRALRLGQMTTIVQEILQDWRSSISDLSPSLWEFALTRMQTKTAGKAFRDSLTAQSLGINEPVARVSYKYKLFLSDIEVVEEMIKKLRETKWANDLDDMDDEDELLDKTPALLSKDDPDLLQDRLKNVVTEAYDNLQLTLSRLWQQTSNDNRAEKSCFLIRTCREIRQHLPKTYQNSILDALIPELQRVVVETVLHNPVQSSSRRLKRIAGTDGLAARRLWEGDPPLPVLPSPWAYRLLLELSTSMTACGSDMWSPQATVILKSLLRSQLTSLIQGLSDHEVIEVNGLVNGNVHGDQEEKTQERTSPSLDGDEEESNQDGIPQGDHAETRIGGQVNGSPSHTRIPSHPSRAQSNDFRIQTLFDIDYLAYATSVEGLNAAENDLMSMHNKLRTDLALESKSVERIRKTAEEYWKRTNLLFGL